MNVKNIHTLTQKSFGGRVLQYNLLESGGEGSEFYGIELAIKEGKGPVQKQSLENICSRKEMVLELIDYLYENAVGSAHFKDVVEDYIVV